jgi:hypothetical protein
MKPWRIDAAMRAIRKGGGRLVDKRWLMRRSLQGRFFLLVVSFVVGSYLTPAEKLILAAIPK